VVESVSTDAIKQDSLIMSILIDSQVGSPAKKEVFLLSDFYSSAQPAIEIEVFHESDLLGKNLGRILERLEFKCISAGIKEKHGCLLADLTFESDVGLDHKLNSVCFELVCQLMPFFPREDSTEMPNGNVLSVDNIGGCQSQLLGLDMGGKLMTEEIEIDPFVGASSDVATQQIAVEGAGFFDVPDRESQVKGFKLAHNAYFR
jgi:hypothetical protein